MSKQSLGCRDPVFYIPIDLKIDIIFAIAMIIVVTRYFLSVFARKSNLTLKF